MKKIILGLCLLLFTVSLNAEGKLLFDLSAQHFSNTILGKNDNYKYFNRGGNYDLANVYVKTDTYKKGNVYYAAKIGGIFTTTLKTKPKNWRITTSIYTGEHTGNIIRLGSNSASNIIITIKGKSITINDKIFDLDIYLKRKNLVISISSEDGIILVKINGQEFYKTKATKFSILRNIEIFTPYYTQGGDHDYRGHLSRLEIFAL